MLKLNPPNPKRRTPFYTVTGTYLGVRLDRSTKTDSERIAKQVFKRWKREIERGEYVGPRERREAEPEPNGPLTFVAAAIAYMNAGGERRFLQPAIDQLGPKLLTNIDQATIDAAAVKAFPRGAASYRNRNFYTPVSAVMKHVGVERKIRRPKGHKGTKRTFWLEPEPTHRLLNAAYEDDPEFGIFGIVLNYTGVRTSENLNLQCEGLILDREMAYVPDTKTGEPRAVYLPPIVIEALRLHPLGLDRTGRLWSFRYSTALNRLKEACKKVGIVLPRRTGLHVFRHNYGTWMRIYGGLDGIGLVRTRVWADLESVERYSHSEPTSEARRASVLPADFSWTRKQAG
jgi:integrase